MYVCIYKISSLIEVFFVIFTYIHIYIVIYIYIYHIYSYIYIHIVYIHTYIHALGKMRMYIYMYTHYVRLPRYQFKRVHVRVKKYYRNTIESQTMFSNLNHALNWFFFFKELT